MKMWICRDEETAFCRLFTSKPEKKYSYYYEKVIWTNGKRNDGVQLDMGDFPEVTFENSPMEVELKIKHNEMHLSSMFRLFDSIVIKDSSDRKRIVKYTEKLIDKLNEEGFYADAKCAEEYLKVFNGELVELVIKKKE